MTFSDQRLREEPAGIVGAGGDRRRPVSGDWQATTDRRRRR